jgi:hypothetical protein
MEADCFPAASGLHVAPRPNRIDAISGFVAVTEPLHRSTA